MLNRKVELSIWLFMSAVKMSLGFMIIGIGGDQNSVVLVLGGSLLMIAGMNSVLPSLFNKIEEYFANKDAEEKEKEQ